LDEKTARHFADIILLARSVFDEVAIETDATPERSILRIQAKYGQYRIFVTELFSDSFREYRYYVLRGNWVEAGFDNSPDPRAVRLKYGEIGQGHAGEPIPHLHLEDKTRLSLTEEMTFEGFIEWLKKNL
jgi:hypothetical protein